jgi:tetratricopeptide (TPR) repeat protein
MNDTTTDFDNWNQRVDHIWKQAPTLDDAELVARIEAIAAERPNDDPAALYELASAYDSAGRELDAEPLYRRALAGDLDAERRAQALIQFASTLRNVGKIDEAIGILAEGSRKGPDPVTGDAATAFFALALIDLGREREAALALLRALTPHLPRYQRSMYAYIEALEAGNTDGA